jgi:hypothetical protein
MSGWKAAAKNAARVQYLAKNTLDETYQLHALQRASSGGAVRPSP